MKAVIESAEGLYLIRIYGSDGLCDTYAIEELEFKTSDILVPLRNDKNGIELDSCRIN